MNSLEWLTDYRQQLVSKLDDLAGLTACSQMVTLSNGERYVLRRQNERATNYGIDYQQEAKLLQLIKPLNIAPEPIYFDEESSLLYWIDGDVPKAFSSELLEKIAVHLAKLHTFDYQAVGSSTFIAKLDLAERCQYLWNKLPLVKREKLPFSNDFPSIIPFTQSICHHDVHLGNLIEHGEQLFLIDWEYAAISDPALDIALFLQANALLAEEKSLFLKCYFNATGFDETAYLAKVEEYMPEIEKLNLLWSAF
ncbi:choline/ethanolamine kinase family protein [Otariodibacter oris]|uniref:Thiamine kinase n=1 Tax=Otariodibacter oris TaxID=1032623 RepID=A0A420XEK8_9PAST|nr:choline/ethanolamine kinase family protein [Otariodibacter oris]QGM80177.1 LPS biosynthesis choline kinase [Otariodibacter oris]RKR70634.1 thiamine kinase [Otariodibacter oris]